MCAFTSQSFGEITTKSMHFLKIIARLFYFSLLNVACCVQHRHSSLYSFLAHQNCISLSQSNTENLVIPMAKSQSEFLCVLSVCYYN